MATTVPDRRAASIEPMSNLYARIPERLHMALKDQAHRTRRSTSAELEVLLDDIFDHKDAPATLERPGA